MAGKGISFANFNLLNLNLPGRPIYDNAAGWSQQEYDAKIRFSAEKIAELDADVIGFQECWDTAALGEVFEKAGLAEDYEIVGRNLEPRGIQVALAVRKGMLRGGPEWIAEFPEDARFVDLREARDAEEMVSVTIRKFSRPPLKVAVRKAPGTPDVTVFVNHLKSKGPTRLRANRNNPVQASHGFIAQTVVSHVRRLVEAGALRAILDAEMKGNDKPVVVLGDLNDATTSTSTELVSGSPGYRFFAKSTAGLKSDAGLYTVEKLQQLRSFRHVYYTHIFKNQMESLDHIMVSDAFYDHSAIRKWTFREMRVLNDHLAASEGERNIHGFNDHGIVVAHFDWNPMVDMVEAIETAAGPGR